MNALLVSAMDRMIVFLVNDMFNAERMNDAVASLANYGEKL